MQRNQSNRLPALDGLRGFAAISVLIFHMGLWLNIPSLAPNSYLAVDLFFCLSGYVLPLAYQHRMDSLPTLLFLRIRLVRLMPLIVLATAISASYMVFAFRKRFAGEDCFLPQQLSPVCLVFLIYRISAHRN
jgi:peptidoglycan/LPS O-acetylase OafA/YrhL